MRVRIIDTSPPDVQHRCTKCSTPVVVKRSGVTRFFGKNVDFTDTGEVVESRGHCPKCNTEYHFQTFFRQTTKKT